MEEEAALGETGRGGLATGDHHDDDYDDDDDVDDDHHHEELEW